MNWRKKINIGLLAIFLLLSSVLRAGKIEQAFEALQIHDYFKAKRLFDKTIKTKEAVSSYGLALIFYRSNNPFHSLDSAYYYIVQTHELYPMVKKNQRQRYSQLIDEHKIDSLRQLVSTAFYERTLNEYTVESFQDFIDQHPWALERDKAVFMRDSLAFELIKTQDNSIGYASYMAMYPSSDFYEQAHQRLMLAQYEETTKPKTLESYELFLAAFPENIYRPQAQTAIYQLVTSPNTIESLENFLTNYPDNHEQKTAWERLYNLNMYDYSAASIRQFSKKYPQYPDVDKLIAELSVIDLPLYPYQQQTKYGFMDSTGQVVIQAVYSSVSPFKEGLALVSKGDKFGYIDKKGDVIIDFLYSAGQDFEQGRAVITRYERLGMIDRMGATIFEPEFIDLDNLSDDLILGMKDSLYAYYDANGKMIIPERFDDAYPFVDGKAKVEENGLQAYIDKQGEYIVMPAFEEIEFFTDELLIFGNHHTYGLMTASCQIVVPNKYERIGRLSEGLAIVVLDGRLGYIDAYGQEVIAPQFDPIPNFLEHSQMKNGVAVVAKNKNYGIINAQGKEVIPLKNEDIGKWSDRIAVKRKGRWGFINRANRLVIAPQFDFAESFVGNTSIIQEFSLQGVINLSGEKIVETAFSNIERTINDFFIINNGALYGIASQLGELVVPMVYRTIRVFDEKTLILTDKDGITYFDCWTQRTLKPQLP